MESGLPVCAVCNAGPSLASIPSSLAPLFHRRLNSTSLTCLDPHRTSRCWRFALDWLNRRRDTPSWQVLRHSSWAERDLFIVVVVRPRIEDECREREGRKGESRLLVIFKRIPDKEGTRFARLEMIFEFIVDALQEIRLPALFGKGRISVVMGQKVKCIGPRY